MATTVVNTTNPNQKLFQAIIMQAFEDCVTSTHSKVDAYNKEDSFNWFKKSDDNYKRICWYADLDPEFVNQNFKKLNKEGKIKFNKTELMWIDYRNRYKQYRAAGTKEARRIIKKGIDRITPKLMTGK
jgi:hypothetical protein|tara:strand:- start:118 stop:501 length:384 start_codon:yes stop_codon:yes gene_type:complete